MSVERALSSAMGAEVSRRIDALGLSVADAAARLGWSEPKLRRVRAGTHMWYVGDHIRVASNLALPGESETEAMVTIGQLGQAAYQSAVRD